MEKDLREKIAELEACRDANVQKKKEIAELKEKVFYQQKIISKQDSEIARLNSCLVDSEEIIKQYQLWNSRDHTEIARLRKALEEIISNSNMGISTEHSVVDIAHRALEGE